MDEAGIRCFVAEGPAISQPRAAGRGLVDCVVVGGRISGLCIAQALVTKLRDKAPDVVVTTVKRDGYLWEEGPNSFQPSDPKLTVVGKEYILVVNSDNIGTIIDPKILNHLIQNKVECCMEARPIASIDVNGDFVNFEERKFQLINGPEDI